MFKELLRLRALACEWAKDAAPYVHPRLATVAHTGEDGGPVKIERIEPARWVARKGPPRLLPIEHDRSSSTSTNGGSGGQS